MSRRRRQEQAIRMIKRLIAELRWRTMPKPEAIRRWFERLPQLQQTRLGKILFGKYVPGNPIQACHVMGVAIVIKSLIWAVKQCNWIPSQSLIETIIIKVINYPGNFVLCQMSYNQEWNNGGQRTIRQILDQGDIDNIEFPQEQVYELVRVLNGIKKRYLKLFKKRCLKKGVPQHVVKQISRYFRKIDQKATQVREQRSRAAFEIPSHDLDQSVFSSQDSFSF